MRVHQPGGYMARRTAAEVEDWSWNTTHDFANTSPYHAGSRSIAVRR